MGVHDILYTIHEIMISVHDIMYGVQEFMYHVHDIMNFGSSYIVIFCQNLENSWLVLTGWGRQSLIRQKHIDIRWRNKSSREHNFGDIALKQGWYELILIMDGYVCSCEVSVDFLPKFVVFLAEKIDVSRILMLIFGLTS